ncbi:hypothetical protein [Pontibacter amylolyticus]|uniref:Immunity protein 30 domain-containing protein n=1 Tax=Pontibacter amylolyticus TaxID=1424080 RepID=A0ABQ1VWK7_9BACT|nr:hypothetical protein [Pontibacter amylolyticus]GGG03075.1 hypothetical protein GCM10011323_04880 [Pontibacter amylolyticus]
MNKSIDENLFRSILEHIDPELDDDKEIKGRAFDLIDILVENHYDDDFCQLIINSIKPGTDLRKVARILDILIWSTPDNGTKLDRLTSNWLNSGDKLKVKTLLFRKDWLPSEDSWSKENIVIKEHFPELIELADFYSEEIELFNKTGLRRINKLKELIKTAGNNA